MTRIAVIADDLTGALDSVSPFACHGLKSAVALRVSGVTGIVNADVIGISTNSRHLGAMEAVGAATDAAIRLKSWAPDLVLKKIDSRLKGNIAAEVKAVAVVFGVTQIAVAPAAPDVGRIVRDGKVTGAGVEVDLDVASRIGAPGIPVAIHDASTADDLQKIAENWSGTQDVLYAGTRGLAAAFARKFGRDGQRPDLHMEAPVILAIGSRDPVTMRQVDHLCAEDGFSRVWAPDGRLAAESQPASRQVYQCSGGGTDSSDVVARRFAAGIAAIVRRHPPRTLLLSGGDTALAVLDELGIAHLEICGEVAPGLPWFTIESGGENSMSAISKSGGFGGDDLLHKLFSGLVGAGDGHGS